MVRINLLPIRSLLRRRELKQFIVIAVGTLASAVIVMLAAYFYVDWTISSLQQKATSLKAKLAELKQKNKEIEDLKNEITRLQKQVDTIQKLTKTRDSPAPFLGAVSLAVPDEVWIGSLNKQGQSFSLDGIGTDNTVVVNFVYQLQRVRQGFTVKRPYVDKKNPGDQTFFSNVQLMRIVAATKPGGLEAVSFQITGSIR
jgi:type IV pilus assembly protein PilN